MQNKEDAILQGNILNRLSIIRFGKPLAEFGQANNLKFDLLNCRNKVSARTGETISRVAIRSWFKNNKPKRISALSFLLEYLDYIKDEIPIDDQKRIELYRDMIWRLTKSIEGLSSVGMPMTSKKIEVDPILLTVVSSVVNASKRIHRSEMEDLFWGGDKDDPSDVSYYLVYRYSTNFGSILKSFIIINKPAKNIRSNYTFNHFIWGGDRPQFRSQTFRECEGFILKFAKSYYFLGYNYTVPANKRFDPESYKKMRLASKWNSTGMGILSIEYDSIDYDQGLFGGVTMTLGANHQPILARVALLHLGTKIGIGRQVSDDMVSPTEIMPDEIASDLNNTMQNLRGLGCRKFGRSFELLPNKRDWVEADFSDVALAIEKMIDNTPSWETCSSNISSSNSAKIMARGAIETYGPSKQSRPRD